MFRSTCVNMSKTWGSALAGMPTPLSVTSIVTVWFSTRAASATSPPSGVYLAALFSRLQNTWVNLTVSPLT